METDTIAVLASQGDPLEREICKHVDELRPLLQPYADIWCDHILIRRIEDNARVEPDWMNFAGSHYSAMVRVFHARDTLKKLQPLVLCETKEEDIGKILLDVHREWASFWEHIGTSIDNLASAFQDSKPPIIVDDGKSASREALMRKYEGIAYAYNRRTQFIHSRIVPATIKNDLVQFRGRITDRHDRRNEPKSSTWEKPYDSEYVLGDILEAEWGNYIRVMTDAWWFLRNALRDKDLAAEKLRKKILREDSSRQFQEPQVAIPYRGTPISNIEMPRFLQNESQDLRNPNFFDPPPPSG
jgi:hypothetical protein